MNLNVLKGERLFTKFTWDLMIVVLLRDQSENEEEERHQRWNCIERCLPRHFKHALSLLFSTSFLEKRKFTFQLNRIIHRMSGQVR